MSYNNLPVHLKPCFLYMGRYGEDEDIVISDLIQLSVAEGFVKPINGKCLEDVAKEYIYELLDRNLLVVGIHNYSLKMHDLVRDLCLREAQKLKFLCVLEEHGIPQDIQSQRCIVGRLSEEKYPTQLLQSLESASLLRSFTLGPSVRKKRPTSLLYNFRLLRVGYVEQDYEEILPWLVNLRFLDVYVVDEDPLPSSIYFLWNLWRLLLHNVGKDYVCEIWKMPQLRHVGTDLREGTLDGAYCLPDTSFSYEEDMVLENLQTLSHVKNLKFGEVVLKRIPNIKTLKLYYKTKVDTSREHTSSSEESSEAEDSSEEEEDFSEGGGGGDT
ncbi:putative late blight resistance protein homolog R1B-16 [Salvia hispanica]|uniref:putative late blight resistance protein homolog R1B-16 n=1 Tax=Salvia hispanica TaxID=49212 RepID=UPI002009CE13|nr:putative late blight resistance protein homolog R1B-16 [Salvia hispanica]